MSRLACTSDRIEARCAHTSVCVLAVCWLVHVYIFFKCVLESISLPLWMCVSKTLMCCQLDFSRLITGCTLGVSQSLTHSHMLFPVLIFWLGCVMLASYFVRYVTLHVHLLSSSLSLHLCPLDVDHHSPCEPKSFLTKHLSRIYLFSFPFVSLSLLLSASFMLSPCCRAK